MKRLVFFSLYILLSSCAFAATVTGKVLDPAGAGISGARLVVTSRLGILQETTTDPAGAFQSGHCEPGGAEIVATAPGFARKAVAFQSQQPLTIELEIAPVSDAITVSGSSSRRR